jgi:hypothetical protein
MLFHYFLNYNKCNKYISSGSFIDTFNGYNNKLVTKASNTKFLQKLIENPISWKAHIDQLISKLYTACYAIRAIKPFKSLYTLKLVYYFYFHSLRNSGEILHII